MSELMYMLTYTLVFILFFSFLRVVNLFVSQYEENHWINFVGMTGFSIESIEDAEDMRDSENTIFIQEDIYTSGDFQEVCWNVDDDDITTPDWLYSWWAGMEVSPYCLSELKESWPWFYEWRWYQ